MMIHGLVDLFRGRVASNPLVALVLQLPGLIRVVHAFVPCLTVHLQSICKFRSTWNIMKQHCYKGKIEGKHATESREQFPESPFTLCFQKRGTTEKHGCSRPNQYPCLHQEHQTQLPGAVHRESLPDPWLRTAGQRQSHRGATWHSGAPRDKILQRLRHLETWTSRTISQLSQLSVCMFAWRL